MPLWMPFDALPGQANSFLHLYKISLSEAERDQQYAELLAPDETLRFEKLIIPNKKYQFLRSRGALRSILSIYLKCDPANIGISVNSSGKPFLSSNPHGLFFNVSHSDHLALIAVASSTVGVDIERIRERVNFLSIGQQFFTLCEQQQLNSYPASQRRRGFYRLWTRKEALLKMHGCGFMQPDTAFAVPECCQHVFFAPGFVASVAMNSSPEQVMRFTL